MFIKDYNIKSGCPYGKMVIGIICQKLQFVVNCIANTYFPLKEVSLQSWKEAEQVFTKCVYINYQTGWWCFNSTQEMKICFFPDFQ